MQLPAVGHADLEASATDRAAHRENSGARVDRRDQAARGLAREAEAAVVLQGAVELAQVIEGDPGPFPGLCILAQVTPGSVAQSLTGHRPQLFLDRHQRRAHIMRRSRRQPDRVDRGEPAQGAGQIGQRLVATVALQFHRHDRRIAPVAPGQGQGRQQHLVDAGTVGAWHLSQQRLGLALIEFQTDVGGSGKGVAAAGQVEGRWKGRLRAQGAPMGDLLRRQPRAGMVD